MAPSLSNLSAVGALSPVQPPAAPSAASAASPEVSSVASPASPSTLLKSHPCVIDAAEVCGGRTGRRAGVHAGRRAGGQHMVVRNAGWPSGCGPRPDCGGLLRRGALRMSARPKGPASPAAGALCLAAPTLVCAAQIFKARLWETSVAVKSLKVRWMLLLPATRVVTRRANAARHRHRAGRDGGHPLRDRHSLAGACRGRWR